MIEAQWLLPPEHRPRAGGLDEHAPDIGRAELYSTISSVFG